MAVPSTESRHVKLFRNNRNQAVRIPVEFELPGDEAIMIREGDRLIIEPVRKRMNIVELLAAWRKTPPLGPHDDFPDVQDLPAKPKNIF